MNTSLANPVVVPNVNNIFLHPIDIILLFSAIAFVIWFVSNWVWIRKPILSAQNAVILTVIGLFVSSGTLSLPYLITYVMTIIAMSVVLFAVTQKIKRTALIMITGIVLSLFVWNWLMLGPILGMAP